LYTDARFKCRECSHGLEFVRYHDDNHLRELLQNLEPTEVYNILLLGGTGAGKSTFLNAFFNYLHFDSLNDALSDPRPLQFLIPGSFYYGIRNGNQLEQHLVRFGEETNSQRFPVGAQSATRNSVIYTSTATAAIGLSASSILRVFAIREALIKTTRMSGISSLP
jgi:hypothetical protein